MLSTERSTPLSGYRRPPAGTQPAYLEPRYVSTRKRAPTQPLILLPHSLSEITGPVFGSDDIKAGATEESKRILRDAQNRADLLLEKTQGKVGDIQREIEGLRLKRKDVETSLEATLHALRNTLEFVQEQDTRDSEDRVLLHRPRFDSMELVDAVEVEVPVQAEPPAGPVPARPRRFEEVDLAALPRPRQ